MNARVSLFVNCFERDYRRVLAPGFMKAKAGQFQFPFERVVVTLNNITDSTSAVALAQEARRRGEVDEFIEVAAALPAALEKCGLSLRDLGLVRHYMDFALVAVAAAAPHYLLYCCAEVDLVTPFDWITDAVAKLEVDPRLLVANPSWASDPGGAQRESMLRNGDHWVGMGFSDQCFLANAGRLAAPIYHYKHAAGGRYPMSDLGDIFEKRVDAYMRHHSLLRLSDARVFYIHAGIEGAGYPKLPLFRRILRKGRKILGFQKASSETSKTASDDADLRGNHSMKGSA
jgi:hypothetical protein